MFSFSGALLISLVVSVLILRWATRGGIFGLGMDHDLDSVQKIHTRPAPRIGGLAVFLAIGVLQWPLLPVMLVLIPLALVLEWRATR